MADDKEKTITPPTEEKEEKVKAATKAPVKTKNKKGGAAPKKGGTEKVEEDPDFKYIVRLVETDLDGQKSVEYALQSIPGIGSRASNVIISKTKMNRRMRIGKLSDEDVQVLSDAIDKFIETAPHWLLNRQKDWETGEDSHMLASELQTVFRDDLNRLKKIRSYRGIRHERGKKVRGQRSRSNGRKGLTLGVIRKKATPGAAAPSAGAPAKGGGGGKGGKK